MDINNIFDSRDSIDFLVRQLLSFEQRPMELMIERQTKLNDRKSILSELDSKLSTLKTRAERLTDTAFDYFGAKGAKSSDPDKITASAGQSAVLGNHSISVERVAVSDTRVSDQFTNTDTSFSGVVGDQTFTIEVAHPIEDDLENRVTIDVTVAESVFAGDDESVISGIQAAINSAMNTAVADETIRNNEVVNASVINEENGTSRLVLRSHDTGYNNRIVFGSSSVLDNLGINAATQSSGTSGGYITEVGTSESTSELNAKFELDGLTLYRSSNSVKDALAGVTLQLNDVFETAETLTITADVAAVKSEVQSFLDGYNEVVDYLRTNARINPDTRQRGALSDDVVYRDLLNNLRGSTNSVVSSTLTSSYDRLFNIGIEADSTGKLSIKDSEKLASALKTNSQYVSDLFNSEDGIAAEIANTVDDFVKSGGTISNSKSNLDNELRFLDQRIDLMDELLNRREAQLRDELSSMQGAMTSLINQQSYFSSLTAAFG